MDIARIVGDPGTKRSGNHARAVYLESDFYMDVDDVGALAIALNLQADGDIDLIGFGINAPNRWGVHTASIYRYVYEQDFPIGVRAGIAEEPNPRDYANARAISTAFREIPEGQAEDGTRALRRALAAAEDGSVTVASVGFMRNLVGLLRSGGDDLSPASGRDLVVAKVSSTLVMGGVFPNGREHNIAWDPAETAEFLASWPVTIDFIGFEAADRAITARGLSEVLGTESPVALAYAIWGAEVIGRPSWDPLTVYLAAYPDTPVIRWSAPGRMVFNHDGTNAWDAMADGPHRYAIPTVPQEAIAELLDEILRRPPTLSPNRAAALTALTDGRGASESA